MKSTLNIDSQEAFSYQFKDKRWKSKLIKAGLLLPFFWLFVPIFIYKGYQIEIIRQRGKRSRAGLPEWSFWNSYLMDGILYYLGLLPYILIGVLPGILYLVIAIITDYNGSITNAISAVLLLVNLIISVPCALVLIFASFYKPYFLLYFIENGTTRGFYSFKTMFAFTKKAWQLQIVILALRIVVKKIAVLLLFIPIVGWGAYCYVDFVCLNFIGQFYFDNSFLLFSR